MSESRKAVYVRDRFYIHAAALWPLDDPTHCPVVFSRNAYALFLWAAASVSARAQSMSGQSPQRV